MKIQEFRKKTSDDLRKLLSELRESTRNLRFKIASREIKNHQLLRSSKKDVAKILTILQERHE